MGLAGKAKLSYVPRPLATTPADTIGLPADNMSLISSSSLPSMATLCHPKGTPTTPSFDLASIDRLVILVLHQCTFR